jgi:hypothetical protein
MRIFTKATAQPVQHFQSGLEFCADSLCDLNSKFPNGLKFRAIIFFLLFSQLFSAKIAAQDSLYKKRDGFFMGGYVAIPAYSTLGTTREGVELFAGAEPFILTARFYRSKKYEKYFFEDAITLGWKKTFCTSFNTTLSLGYADLAFEHDSYTFPEIARENFDKRPGLIIEEKLGYRFHTEGKDPGPWGIAANYYCILNNGKLIQGWSAGIDLTLDYAYRNSSNHIERIGERKSKRAGRKADKKEKVTGSTITVGYKYRIRTNFITGMAFSPHLDFEHRYNVKWGWGIGVFAWPAHGSRTILRMFENPDFQMSGGGGFVDWIYFQPCWKNDHYWTFGLRCGYRDLAGVCAIGTKVISPDYYITRSRKDIVTAWRVSFVMPPEDSHWSIDWYFTAGMRTSFYKTKFPQYANFESSFLNPKTGCYVLPEFTGGLELGFGW